MKIYIASSCKNEKEVLDLGKVLRENGHEVDMFVEKRYGRKVFKESEIKNKFLYNVKTFLKIDKVKQGFKEDKKWIDWSDCVVMLLPCGKSAHLEIAYAIGRGKLGFAYGYLPSGDVDVMYGFLTSIYEKSELNKMLNDLKNKKKIAKWRKNN